MIHHVNLNDDFNGVEICNSTHVQKIDSQSSDGIAKYAQCGSLLTAECKETSVVYPLIITQVLIDSNLFVLVA